MGVLNSQAHGPSHTIPLITKSSIYHTSAILDVIRSLWNI